MSQTLAPSVPAPPPHLLVSLSSVSYYQPLVCTVLFTLGLPVVETRSLIWKAAILPVTGGFHHQESTLFQL